MGDLKPYFKPFDETETYTQDDVEGLSFRKVLPDGIVADINMGLVVGKGPLRKMPGIHEDFDQTYLVFQGSGYINLDDDRIRIDKPGIVVIPRGTNHSMEIDADQVMKYVYVNRKA